MAPRQATNHQDVAARLTPLLNGLVRFVARHWLFMFNLAVGALALLPVLPPFLLRGGNERAANLIYLLYRPLCHQLPERSFFLFGHQFAYTLRELQFWVNAQVPLRFTGDATVGYKMAICERDTGVYGAMLVAGLAFSLLRHRLKPLSVRGLILLTAPMAIDGVGQLLLFWDSTWWSRMITGALFGIACVWLACPYVEKGMADVLKTASRDRASRA